MSDSWALPESSEIFTPITRASGATPRYWPLGFLAAMMPATWVPWPCPSAVVVEVLLRLTANSLPAGKSGWLVSSPVSTTATVMPLPVAWVLLLVLFQTLVACTPAS